MKEIEILVEVFDTKDRVKEILNSFNYIGLNKVVVEYYYDPKRNTLKPSKEDELYHCLRLRYETEVEKIDMLKEIFNKIGLVKFIEMEELVCQKKKM